MGKITGLEDIQQIPPKVLQLYQAVLQLVEEGADVGNIRVSAITERAGIGKGTAYEYFDSKEEIVACAVVYRTAILRGWLQCELEKRESFAEQLDFLLDEICKRNCEMNGLLQLIHILTDHTELSRLIRQKMESKAFEPYTPVTLFRNVIDMGIQKGELRSDLPPDYQVYTLLSHLMTYMLAIHTEQNFHIEVEQMRNLVYQELLKELCEKNR